MLNGLTFYWKQNNMTALWPMLNSLIFHRKQDHVLQQYGQCWTNRHSTENRNMCDSNMANAEQTDIPLKTGLRVTATWPMLNSLTLQWNRIMRDSNMATAEQTFIPQKTVTRVTAVWPMLNKPTFYWKQDHVLQQYDQCWTIWHFSKTWIIFYSNMINAE